MLPPGISFLLVRAPGLLWHFFCLGFVYYAFSVLLGFDLELPAWLIILLLSSSLPLTAVLKLLRSNLQSKWEAEALGAVPPPIVKGRLPGNVDTLFKIFKGDETGYLADVALERSISYGWTFNWRLFWEDKIITSEPEHVKAILATEFHNYEKGDTFKNQMQILLGDGVFNADGEMWKFHRSMTRPFFSKDRIQHFEIFRRHADEAIVLMKARLRTGHAIDIQDLVSRFTLDSATEFLFGHCVHILSAGLPYSPNAAAENSMLGAASAPDPSNAASLFSQAFADAQSTAARRGRFGSLWPLFEFWKDKTQEDMKVINTFIEPILQEAVTKKKALKGTGAMQEKKEIEEGATLLDHLINYTEDTKILRDEILNIMIAGRDTTAATLAFALYCLAMHPEVLKRLREEILTVVGSERNPTYDDLKEMKFLRAVINETLRLYPPVPFDQRSTINATTLPNKIPGAKPWYIPARTRVVYSVFLMHRRTDLWGPDAVDFDPDRFLDERLHRYLTPNPFIFLPFNAGPRICLGQQFAYNETSFMLIRLLQAFDAVELAPDAQPPKTRVPAAWAKAAGERKSKERVWPKSHLTMYAHGGLWVRLHEASLVETA
ncbi:cytochrome P450 monooxygenase pc-1 [Phellopilus nigrolimitatus]|nr:cytochrome P450 monooxygenase pc-1 [Phellopilus nigrolimitatus]